MRNEGMRLLRDSYVPEALRGERRTPMLPEDVTKALEAFIAEVKQKKRRVEVVPYNGQIVYANAI
jgi:hypothetical protein